MNLEACNLKKRYGGFELDIPSLKINQGEIFGLVGNNGAGKTTLLRLCLDLIEATHGYILSGDIDVAKNEGWKKYTGSFLDEGFLIDYLTPMEYFEFIASLHKMSKDELQSSLNRFGDFFNNGLLTDGKYIRDLSTGNKNKTGIAGAMLFHPSILILDEPFANLDPTSRQYLNRLLKDFNTTYNSTILLSSHNLDNVAEVCTRVAILDNGQIKQDMTVNDQTYQELQEFFKI